MSYRVLVTTVAFCLALIGTADAGTVSVTPHINTNSQGASDGWPGSPNGFWLSGQPRPIGTYAWVKTQQLPANVNLDEFFFTTSHANGAAGNEAFNVRLCYGGLYGSGVGGMCAGDAFGYLGPDGNGTPRGLSCGVRHAESNPTYRCASFQFAVSGSITDGFAAANLTSANVSDYVAPIVTNGYNSDDLTSGRWLRGTVSGGSVANDVSGVGVKLAEIRVDNAARATSTYGCNYAAWIPCTQVIAQTGSVDTTAFTDGPHTVQYTATDAANTAGAGNAFTAKFDNTRPATPSNIQTQATGLQGWSTANTFGATWDNNGETTETTTQSGIDQVVVDVNPTDSGAQSDPAPVTIPVGSIVSGISATRSSVSGVTLPAKGLYKIQIKLIDKAGNQSLVGSGSDSKAGWDDVNPNAPAGQQNGWISRDELAAGYDQDFTYTAPSNAVAPVCGFASAIDKNINGVAGATIDVPGGGAVRKLRLPGTLDEATHYVHLRAVSCTNVASLQTNTTEAKVDRTDPVGTIAGVENGRWYRDGQAVTLSGADALSGMAPAPPSEDASTKGAYLAYTINGSGPADVNAPRGDSTTFPVTGEGSKELRFSPVDLAGNKAAAKVLAFGVDATNPTGYINAQESARPTLLSASLGDVPSGVSYAIFAVRAAGSNGAWTDLPTSLTGVDGKALGVAVNSGVATARFPDTDLPSGTYDVRVRAFDQAGNELYTNQLKDGSLAQVENPMRNVSSASLTLAKAARECKRMKNGKMKCTIKKCPKSKKQVKKYKGTCYKIRNGKVVLQGAKNTVTTEFKRGAIAIGTLADASGKPLANTEVNVTTKDKVTGVDRNVGAATTDSKGIYAIRVPAGVNKSVKASFDGSELRRPTSTTATMNSKAKLTLRVPKKAKTGQTITFYGKITSYDANYPTGGKIAALQFFAAKKWRPAVAVSHTDSKGRFKIRYKFDGRKVKAKIIFRVIAPSEDGWGHVYSVSKPKIVKLNY